MNFNGLTTVNVELTSRCNKDCWMCGRRKIERDFPSLALKYDDMDFSLLESVASQLPDRIVVQLHNNGEPLLYPRFREAACLFKRQIRCMDTNGILLIERADDIIGNLDTLTVSIFEKDPLAEEQYETIEKFLRIKGDRRPNIVLRCLGAVDVDRYAKFGCITATRILHSSMGSFNYTRKPTVPEIGICLDFLSHMVIRSNGDVSICVRFDPEGLGIIGNCRNSRLEEIWNCELRSQWFQKHIDGKRSIVPLCRTCEFWGVPTGMSS